MAKIYRVIELSCQIPLSLKCKMYNQYNFNLLIKSKSNAMTSWEYRSTLAVSGGQSVEWLSELLWNSN